jgi:hypothetical protein
MSNYTKTTNFATKDNLSPGNPLKIVKGAEIDTEYNNIATAVATKTDNASAAITGGTIVGITDLAVADGGTGASTAAGALNNLLPSQTSAANKYLQSDGTNASWDAVSLSTSDITGTLPVANGGTGVTSSTGTGNVVLSNSPTLVTPALGTPSALVGTNITGTASGLTAGNVTTNANLTGGVTSVGNAATVVTNANLTGAVTSVGNATSLGSFTSANLLAALTDETGTGSAVFATSPTLVTPALGTPSALVGTNITGTASGLTAGNVTTNANLTGDVTSVGNATTLTNAPVIAKVLTGYVSGAGTVAATDSILQAIQKLNGNDATNANLTGAITSVGNATSLGSFSSANLLGALTDETGTGSAVFATSPTLVTPILGTPTSGTLTNATGLPLSTGVTGTLPVANGGTGTSTPSIVAGTNVTVTGTWPNQTIAASGGSTTPGGSTTQVQYNNAGAFGGITGATTNGVALTLVAPVLGTPASGVATNLTGLPLSTGVTGTLPVANGGTGQTTYTDGQLLIGNSTGNTLTKATLTAGTNVTITNAAGAITIAASGGGGGSPGGSTTQVQYNNAGAFGGISGATTNGTALTLTGAILNGTIGATTPSTGAFTTVSASNGSGARAISVLGGSIESFYDSSAVEQGRIQATTSALYVSTVTTNPIYVQVNSTTVGTFNANGLGLGGTTPSSGTGITFPATQSASSNANTLDDYEEGTWTPVVGGNATYSAQHGLYTKVGRVVTIQGRIDISTLGTGSTQILSGLPFTCQTVGGGTYAVHVAYFASLATNSLYVVGTPLGGTTQMYFNHNNTSSATFTNYFAVVFGNSTRIDFAGSYLSDS